MESSPFSLVTPHGNTNIDLPKEIRGLIYGLYYGSAQLQLVWNEEKPVFSSNGRKLLLVSHQVRQEAEDALYANVTLLLHHHRGPDLTRWPSKLFQQLRHLRVRDFSRSFFVPAREMYPLHDVLSMAMPNLQTLFVALDGPYNKVAFGTAAAVQEFFIPDLKADLNRLLRSETWRQTVLGKQSKVCSIAFSSEVGLASSREVDKLIEIILNDTGTTDQSRMPSISVKLNCWSKERWVTEDHLSWVPATLSI